MSIWWVGSITPVIIACTLTGRTWLMWLSVAYGACIIALYLAAIGGAR